MEAKTALCPDGKLRAYTVQGEIAFVNVRGYRVEGKITEEGGLTKFRQVASHPGAHLMWYPARAD